MQIIEKTLYSVLDTDIVNGRCVLPKNVTRVCNMAFSDLGILREIDLQDIITIGPAAFRGCISLEKVKMLKIKHLEDEVFNGCISLKRPGSKIRKEIYENTLENLTDHGLCISVDKAINEAIIKYKKAISVTTCFPNFTYENAVRLFGAKGRKYGNWWPIKDIEIRKVFLLWCYEDL